MALVIRGREITTEDIVTIKAFVNKYSDKGRKHISRELCKHWNWRQPQGSLKDCACRQMLLRLEKKGYIKLPARKHESYNERRGKTKFTKVSSPKLKGKLGGFGLAELKLVNKVEERRLWDALVKEFHYQGYKLIVGSFLKYLVHLQGKVVACLGWGSAAWNTECRDKYIGWDKEVKDQNLHYIVNNIRFLILPDVKVKYLASHLLSLSVKQLPQDWQKRYGHPIYLLETFVERDRFAGTSYKAANWIHVGETKGFSKRGSSHYRHRNIKNVYVYPLIKDFRERLQKL
jgi:hypothetical protein